MTTAKNILDNLPIKTFRSIAAYYAHNKRAIEAAGHVAVTAEFDMAGNCVYCGEAGRCPGWHTAQEPRRVE